MWHLTAIIVGFRVNVKKVEHDHQKSALDNSTQIFRNVTALCYAIAISCTCYETA